MFRIGIVQNNPAFLKPKPNVAACLELMDQLKADLWVLPELFNSGYNFKTKKEAAACAERSDGPLVGLLQTWALAKDTAVVAGFPEKAGAKLYNSAIMVEGGRAHLYRKTHLFGNEKKFFAPGDTGFWVKPVKGVKVGVMICFDWFFPESCRTLALKGAQVVAPNGALLARLGSDEVRALVVETDPWTAKDKKVHPRNDLFADRRPKHYKLGAA